MKKSDGRSPGGQPGRSGHRLRLVALLAPPLVALAALLFSMVGLEIFLRVTGMQSPFLYRRDGQVCATHVAGLEVNLPGPEGRVKVRFNRAGYRDRERSTDKPPGTLRIAFLGDSFIEALQVPFERTAGQVLEAALQKRLPARRIEVLNLASSGFGTDCCYLTFHHRGLSYQPDLVVLAFYIGNDVYDNHPELANEPQKPFFYLSGDGSLRLQPFPVRDNSVKRWLRAHSRAFLFLRNRIERLAVLRRVAVRFGLTQETTTLEERLRRGKERKSNSIFVDPSSPLLEEAWDITDRIIGKLAEETSRRGIPVVVLIIPSAEQLDEDAARHYREALSPAPGQRLDFKLPDRRIRRILERRNLPFVDLQDVFRSNGHPIGELYYPGEGHWTLLGNRMAADSLLGPILDLLGTSDKETGR